MNFESVQVPAEWVQKAKDIGTARDSKNGGNDTAAYAHTGRLPYSSLTASRLAALGEVAAHFYFGVDPEGTEFVVDRTEANYKALKANADLRVNGYKIEVRNCANKSNPIPVKKKDADANAIVVQVHVEMDVEGKRPTGKVEFIGWRNAATSYRPQHARRGTDYREWKLPMSDLNDFLGGEADVA